MEEQKVVKYPLILSFQPFSILGVGGGARIIRRLIEDNEQNIVFFSLLYSKIKNNSNYNEIVYNLIPTRKRWMRSFIRDFVFFLRDSVLYKFNNKMIISRVSKIDFDVLHVIDHFKYSNCLTKYALEKGKPIWVSFHDHFNSTDNLIINTSELWKSASKRMVISSEMGEHYCKLFGQQSYIVVTDGLKESEISISRDKSIKKDIAIYFGGLVHLDYYPLFNAFSSALETLHNHKDYNITLILRGTQSLDFLTKCSFTIEYRPFTIDNVTLQDEMNSADVLYLPIKFTDEYFYKYSFSTKMIGYLGASGNIFYHGPKDAAAAKFLDRNNCGVMCDSFEKDNIIGKLLSAINNNEFSVNAKKVAFNDFLLKNIQKRFWS